MGKANQKNCSMESVVNDANMDCQKEYYLFNKDGIIAKKQNAEKKEYLRWSFDKKGNMTEFSKGNSSGHNEFVQFLGNRIYLKETFYDETKGGTNKVDVIVESPDVVRVRKNGVLVSDKAIVGDYKEKLMGYKYATKSFSEIEKALKENGYKKNQKMNFSIDSQLIALARESKSFDEYIKKANANGYFDMMEIGQNWEARKRTEFSVGTKKPILTFWF